MDSDYYFYRLFPQYIGMEIDNAFFKWQIEKEEYLKLEPKYQKLFYKTTR